MNAIIKLLKIVGGIDMDKKQLFKISGTVEVKTYSRSETIKFEGHFVKRGENEIIRINEENGTKFFLKGLFIEHTQLIFIEETEKGTIIRGYAFTNIKNVGRYSFFDWLCGLFSGELEEMPATIQIESHWDPDIIRRIEKDFAEFYEGLGNFDKWFFDRTNKLTEHLTE